MSSERSRSDRLYEVYLGDPNVGHITEEAVRSALEGLSVEPVRSYRWMADAIRGAVYFGYRFANSRDGQKGNAAVRDEIASLAERAGNLWVDLFNISSEADSAMWDYAWRRSPERSVDQPEFTEPAEFEMFRDTRARIQWLGLFLRDVAADLGANVETSRWIQAERKRLRIMLARCLSVVFESGFGLQATHKNGGSNLEPETYGVWADFLCRILRLAKVEGASTNLSDVLREARRLHLSEPVVFEPGILPE
jgi:hypothetical protein